MFLVPYTAGAILALLPAVTALRPTIGEGEFPIFADFASFDPPSLEYGNFIMYWILLVGTLIQFGFTARALCRGVVRVPAIGVAVALFVLMVTYTLGITLVATTYTLPDVRSPKVDFLRLETVSLAFFYLKDPAMFAAVALFIGDRHLALCSKLSGTIKVACVACVLLVVMIALIGADVGNFESTIRKLHLEIPFDEAVSRWNRSDNVAYAFVAFHILGTVFLAIIAFLVRTRTKNDKIMSWILFAVIPLLGLHAVARLIFVIFSARSSFTNNTNQDGEYAMDAATTIVYGTLYLAIMSVLVYLLSNPHLWNVRSRSRSASVEDTPAEKRTSFPKVSTQGSTL